MKKFVFSTILVFAVALICAACGSAPTTNGGGSSSNVDGIAEGWNNAPDWLKKGKTESFCGIGGSRIAQNFAQSRAYAEKRAATTLGENIKTHVKELFEDYSNEFQDGDNIISQGSGEAMTEQIVNEVVQHMQLEDSHVLNQYVFTLKCIKPEIYNKIFEKVLNANTVSEQAKKEIMKRKDDMRDRLHQATMGAEEKKEVEQYIAVPEGKQN